MADHPGLGPLDESTCAAWSSIDRLRCRTPRPPCRAIAIAIRASVTVSMGEEISGSRTVMRLETRVEVSTSLGTTSLSTGTSRTSSKVRPTASNIAGTPLDWVNSDIESLSRHALVRLRW